MSLFTKEMMVKLTAGTALTGMVAFGVASWTGTTDLATIEGKFNWVKTQYNTALDNIENYKEALNRGATNVNQLKATISSLEAEISELEANGREEDKDRIVELEGQVADLQAQLDTAVTEENYNTVVAEVKRLQGELDKANSEVATLKNTIVSETEALPETTAVSVDQILAETPVGKNSTELLKEATLTFASENTYNKLISKDYTVKVDETRGYYWIKDKADISVCGVKIDSENGRNFYEAYTNWLAEQQ